MSRLVSSIDLLVEHVDPLAVRESRCRGRWLPEALVKAHAHSTVVDAMDLALLTGQRPADVLKIRCRDIRDGALWIVQSKTGARIGI